MSGMKLASISFVFPKSLLVKSWRRPSTHCASCSGTKEEELIKNVGLGLSSWLLSLPLFEKNFRSRVNDHIHVMAVCQGRATELRVKNGVGGIEPEMFFDQVMVGN
jgi:hypothetical protein